MAHFPELAGKVAIVTGGTAGIGRAITEDLAREGVRLMVMGRANIEAAQQTVAALRDLGTVAEYFLGDAGRAADVQRLVEETTARLGPVDILVNCAGGFPGRKNVWEIAEDEWDQILTANLKSAFLCTRAVLPGMIERGWGRVVNISSEVGRMPVIKTAAHYAASKAGMIGFTKHVALETAGTGVTCNATAPATTWSERIRHVYPDAEARAMAESKSPMGRLAEPEEQSSVVTYLCSQGAAFITGACIEVTGAKVMI
jgi:NAD(P)-dependent dehydrogenase (short-subunit alcohol dehydrogenase family)